MCLESWYKNFDFTIPQEATTRVELDERTTWFYEAVTSSRHGESKGDFQ